MIFPSVECQIIPYTDKVDEYGQQVFTRPKKALCSVVKLTTSTHKTSVRTDSSGSGGSAKEINAAARLLFKLETKLSENDRIDIDGVSLRVIEVQVRYAVFSRIPDHLQVDLKIWA